MAETADRIRELLQVAGITINGSEPWDIQIKDPRFYNRVLQGGSLALGESYVEGWWEVEKLDEFFNRVLRANLGDRIAHDWRFLLQAARARLFNVQDMVQASSSVRRHYDKGNNLYQAMLDKRLVYTCAYWKQAADLDTAQDHKLDLVCRKIGLKSGQRILDIGCGWGSFAKFAAERYGAIVTGVTLSPEQVALGKKLCTGLPVDILLQDYRQIKGTFDHIISLGMFEHVGVKNYRTYMQVAREHLAEDGFFLLHTIGGNHSATTTDPWLDRYIFPGSLLPSAAQITRAIGGVFVIEDWHNFGPDYDRTLMAWWYNFDRYWPELEVEYGKPFYRTWKYYLLSCAGSFRARKNQLWQIVLSKKGIVGGYQSIR